MNVITLDDLILTADKEVPISLKMAEQGIAIKNINDQKVLAIKKEEIRTMEIFRSTRRYNLRITAQNTVFNINNIPENQTENIKKCSSEWYSTTVYSKELEVTTPQNGTLGVTGDYLEFRTNKTIFDVPLKEIDGVTEIKDELLITFKGGIDNVFEMSVANTGTLLRDITERCTQLKAQSVVTFESIQSLYPRGKNTFVFYPNFVKMVGRTFEHQIFFSSIQMMWFLENQKDEEKEQFLVLKIDPAIKQGQTRYEHIVLAFEDYSEDIEVNIDDELKINKPNLKNLYTGDIGESFTIILEELSGIKAIRQGDFVTSDNQRRIKCFTKAYEGHIYPMDDCLLFLTKVIHMRHSDIQVIEFSRINISSHTGKTFDMKVITYDGQFLFNSLLKEEFGALERYFAKHNIQIRSEVLANDIDEDEDEDYESEGEDYTSTDIEADSD
ncbi:FACT complex subunit Ssrp1 [Dictyocoela muelleri]|nr:FACT complex subunit Ssrp1 [Dictyocoela muelleri]